jgi:hypothetical protein
MRVIARTLSAQRLLLAAALLATLLLAGAARPQPAAAATPCWKSLLNDWYDGRIDGTYQLHCYRDALKHLPSDVDTYSSARSDIERALQSALEAARKAGRKVGPTTLIRPSSSARLAQVRGAPTITIEEPKRSKHNKGLAALADDIDPGGPSSVPLPLLVLGGLAIVLVAAGGLGFLLRRAQGRPPDGS